MTFINSSSSSSSSHTTTSTNRDVPRSSIFTPRNVIMTANALAILGLGYVIRQAEEPKPCRYFENWTCYVDFFEQPLEVLIGSLSVAILGGTIGGTVAGLGK